MPFPSRTPGGRWGLAAGLLLALLTPVAAQNLVPNPGFEAYSQCPPYPGQIHLAEEWDSPNNNTTDYFHRCAPTEDGASVPANLLGTQSPYAGHGYAGIRTWIPVIPGNPEYREYLSVQLTQPLAAGATYALSFQASLAETASHASDDLGMYLSATPFDNERRYERSPHLRLPTGEPLENETDWMRVAGTYTAQGGEQYLLIGAFETDEEMLREKIRENDEPKVYYYIDEVVVRPCMEPTQLDPVVDTDLCRGEQLLLEGPADAVAYRWDNLSTTRERSVQEAGTYIVVSAFDCYRLTTTYLVRETACSCAPSLASPQLLAPVAADGRLRLRKSDHVEVTSVRLYDMSGRRQAHFAADQLSLLDTYQLSSGMYIYELHYECRQAGGILETGRRVGKVVMLR